MNYLAHDYTLVTKRIYTNQNKEIWKAKQLGFFLDWTLKLPISK